MADEQARLEHQAVVSVAGIVNMLQTAARGKGKTKTKHRMLMMNAAYALQQLVQRLDAYENPARKM